MPTWYRGQSAGYSFDATVRFSEEDLARLYTSIDRKQIAKAILRSADVAVGMIVTKVGKLMDAEEPAYMRTRRKGLLRDYRRQAVRMRARFEGAVARSRTAVMGGAALALEIGGTYEQFVHGYQRMVSTAVQGQTTSMRRVTVQAHKRERTESARTGAPRWYLDRGFESVGPVWDVPLQRAIEAVFAHGKVPHAPALRKGLSA